MDIDDAVMQRLREESVKRGATMSALVEAGIRLILDDGRAYPDEKNQLPDLPRWKSGGHTVDISNRTELYRVMEER